MAGQSEWYDPQPQVSPVSINSTAHLTDTKGQNSMQQQQQQQSSATGTHQYAFFETVKFKFCFLAMCFNVILYALDQYIVVVAVPQILEEFKALDKVEWINTAFFIASAGGILLYSQIMTVFSLKWVYISAVVIFEIGCAVAGASQNMNMLIVGRAIAGLGGAGMWNASFLISGLLIPFEKRATYFGLFGASYVLASVAGPLVGGALTDASHSGWRWTFYLNEFPGAITLVMLTVFLPRLPALPAFDLQPDHRPIWHKLLRLDWISAGLTVGFVTCLCVGLQWGGITKAWSSPSVIVILVMAGVLLLAFFGWSWFMGSRAMLPLSLFRRAHFGWGMATAFFGYSGLVIYLYFVPMYFEAVKDKTATRAGVLLLGLQIAMCIMLILAGKMTERIGYGKYFIVGGSVCLTVGGGLWLLLRVDTSLAAIEVFLAIVGLGFGSVINVMLVMIQADYLSEPHLVPHVTNICNFWGFVGRVVAMTAATNTFENILRQRLFALEGLSLEAAKAVAASPEAVWTAVPEAMRAAVLTLYTAALNKVWWFCMAFGAGTLVSALMMKNLNLKELTRLDIERRNRQKEVALTPVTPSVEWNESKMSLSRA